MVCRETTVRSFRHFEIVSKYRILTLPTMILHFMRDSRQSVDIWSSWVKFTHSRPFEVQLIPCSRWCSLTILCLTISTCSIRGTWHSVFLRITFRCYRSCSSPAHPTALFCFLVPYFSYSSYYFPLISSKDIGHHDLMSSVSYHFAFSYCSAVLK